MKCFEAFKVAATDPVGKVKELLHEGIVRQIVLKRDGIRLWKCPYLWLQSA